MRKYACATCEYFIVKVDIFCNFSFAPLSILHGLLIYLFNQWWPSFTSMSPHLKVHLTYLYEFLTILTRLTVLLRSFFSMSCLPVCVKVCYFFQTSNFIFLCIFSFFWKSNKCKEWSKKVEIYFVWRDWRVDKWNGMFILVSRLSFVSFSRLQTSFFLSTSSIPLKFVSRE